MCEGILGTRGTAQRRPALSTKTGSLTAFREKAEHGDSQTAQSGDHQPEGERVGQSTHPLASSHSDNRAGA
jgi:hypothetical protein